MNTLSRLLFIIAGKVYYLSNMNFLNLALWLKCSQPQHEYIQGWSNKEQNLRNWKWIYLGLTCQKPLLKDDDGNISDWKGVWHCYLSYKSEVKNEYYKTGTRMSRCETFRERFVGSLVQLRMDMKLLLYCFAVRGNLHRSFKFYIIFYSHFEIN